MPKFLSIAEQAAEHLKNEVFRGRWSSELPGKHQLAQELGLNSKTIEAALRILEASGLIVSQGSGRRKRIQPPAHRESSALRLCIILNDGKPETPGYHQTIWHELMAAGHTLSFFPKSITSLQFDVPRIARIVESMDVDGWIVRSGPRPLLEWFAEKKLPVFAHCGVRSQVPVAGGGPMVGKEFASGIEKLISLGHHRIVLLTRRMLRLPVPGLGVRFFRETLKAHGLRVSDYNLPDWDDKAGFLRCLTSLFQVTPPTALIVDEPTYYLAALHFLSRLGLRVPHDVSLICLGGDYVFRNCEPQVSHFTWDHAPLQRRLARWLKNVSIGQEDITQIDIPYEFVCGGTIGPART